MADVDLDALERELLIADAAPDFFTLTRAEAIVLGEVPALITELRRLRGQMCETCRHRRMHYTNGKACARGWCEQWSEDIPGAAIIRCSDIRGCRAHEPKAGA